MTENQSQDDVPTTGGITGPPDPTHENTTPPGNPDADQGAVDEAEDKLRQAGGGH
jgi:hypothetical protein